MHIDSVLLPASLLSGCWLLFLAGMLVAARWAPWQALLHTPARMHLVAGGAVALLLLWLLNIRTVDGLVLHLLGMTTFTLVVGWCLAVLAATVALFALTVLLELPLAGAGVAWCLTVFLPALSSWGLGRLLYRPRLRNPFFYILGAGFAGGGLVVLVDALAALGIFAAAGLDRWIATALELSPLLVLAAFSEAFINGMCISALAVFHPDAVKTFDDRFYLDDS